MKQRSLSATIAAVALLSCACGTPQRQSFTIAATGTSAEPAPWVDSIGGLAADHAVAAAKPGYGAVSVLLGPNPEAFQVDLTPMRDESEVEQDPELADTKVKGRLSLLQDKVIAARAAPDGLDLLGTFRDAVRMTPAPGTIVLVSSGVQTEDPVDLRELGWDFDVPATVADLAARGLIPDASGRRVVLVGLGATAGTQPRLPLPAEAKVTALWQAVCVKAGARCEVSGAGLTGRPGADRPAVPVVPTDATPTRCQGTQIVPDQVTFERNESTVLDGADAVLRPIAEQLKRCPAGRGATVTGHTAAVPSGDKGLALSLDRATAIRDRLIALGAPAGVFARVEGLGCTRPIVDNVPGGVFTESLARLNRRVEITITDVH